jgi:hypothetical protein
MTKAEQVRLARWRDFTSACQRDVDEEPSRCRNLENTGFSHNTMCPGTNGPTQSPYRRVSRGL